MPAVRIAAQPANTNPKSRSKLRKAAKPKRVAGVATARRKPVLDPDVRELMTLSANLQRTTARQLRSLWRDMKLSERGLYILELVGAGLDRPGFLIEYFDVLPSTITFETDKLVAAGLLAREPIPGDRRAVRLSLTDAGRAVHRQTTDALNAVLRPQLAKLPRAELDRFLETFHKIVDPVRPPTITGKAKGSGRQHA